MRINPRPWAQHAACKDMDTTLFFPESHPKAKAAQACSSCPVRLECLVWAIENDEQGMWGGLSHRNRSKNMLPDLYRQLEERSMAHAS